MAYWVGRGRHGFFERAARPVWQRFPAKRTPWPLMASLERRRTLV